VSLALVFNVGEIDLGHFALILAWLLSLYAVGAGILGAKRLSSKLTKSAANATHAVAILSTLSIVCLAVLFVLHDYRYAYVWRTSNNDMSPVYLVSAVWGGMDGSMLLWAVFTAIYASVAVSSIKASRKLASWVIPMLNLSSAFFLSVVVLLTNPFRFNPGGISPPDGNGLNPLLQNPSMMIHPPCLYLGFTGFVVPFAYALAVLVSGETKVGWTEQVRRATLIGWGFLTAGIILGGNWAYIELGWGGFWAWDPVENASFLPWLAATAYLHSAMVEERRGMLRIWNLSLAILTYLLVVFGTFLTRSGIVQSVHAFASSDVGEVFLFYVGGVILLTAYLIVKRRALLRSDRHIESYLSREAVFLFNNLLLLGVCFATLWGVMFPVLSEAFTGTKSVVGPPFFNAVNTPLFLALLFFMGVGPLIAWRRSSPQAIAKIFAKPFLLGLALAVLFFYLDTTRPYAALSFGLCLFVAGSVMGEFHRAIKVRRELGSDEGGSSVVALLRTKPRRYGGLLVHLGVALMAVSITASTAYKVEKDVVLKIGESVEVSRYTLKLLSLDERPAKNYSGLAAVVQVSEGGKVLGELHPERRFYPRGEEVTTEVDIRMTWRDDLYLALAGIEAKDGPPSAVFKVFVNPLQFWLWVGAVVVIGGTFVVLRGREQVIEAESASAALPSEA
jgi:cytochrome c-type biogenesis protein CcmF